jgi:hypothetical protein
MSHPKNKDYVRKWRLSNRDKYLEQHCKQNQKRYYYRQGIKELMKIDPSLFY